MWHCKYHEGTYHAIHHEVHTTRLCVTTQTALYQYRSEETGDKELCNDMTALEGRCGAAVHGCNDADELSELGHVVRSAPRRKDLVGQVIGVSPFLL